MHHLRGSPPQSGEIIALSHYDEGSHALMVDLMGLLVDGRGTCLLWQYLRLADLRLSTLAD